MFVFRYTYTYIGPDACGFRPTAINQYRVTYKFFPILLADFLGDLSGISPMRRRHHPRGTRRGRPRGSTRRGGGHGSIPRVLTTQAATPAVPATASQAAAAGTGAAAGTSSPLPQQEVSGGGDNAGVPLHEEGKYT